MRTVTKPRVLPLVFGEAKLKTRYHCLQTVNGGCDNVNGGVFILAQSY